MTTIIIARMNANHPKNDRKYAHNSPPIVETSLQSIPSPAYVSPR